MITTIIITTWLVQSALAYRLFRKLTIREFGTWKRGDRRFYMILSCLPVALMTAGVVYWFEASESDEPASW